MDAETMAAIDASRERLRAVVESLSDEELGRQVEGDWTVSALLAHIAFWDRRAAGLLRRCMAGRIAPSPIDLDSVNDSALHQWRLVPPRAAAEEALAAATEVDGLVAGLSADLVAAIQTANAEFRKANAAFRYDRSQHRQQHVDQIERALRRA